MLFLSILKFWGDTRWDTLNSGGYINDNLNITVNLIDSTQNYQIRRGGGDFYYTSTSTIEYIKYEVFIINANGSLFGIYEIDVYIEYDNIIMKYFISP